MLAVRLSLFVSRKERYYLREMNATLSSEEPVISVASARSAANVKKDWQRRQTRRWLRNRFRELAGQAANEISSRLENGQIKVNAARDVKHLAQAAVADALGINALPAGHLLLFPPPPDPPFPLNIPGDTGTTDFTQAPWNLPEPIIGALDDRLIATLFTQTGAISTHHVNPADVLDPNDLDGDSVFNEPDGILDDPFLFAETGEVAGE